MTLAGRAEILATRMANEYSRNPTSDNLVAAIEAATASSQAWETSASLQTNPEAAARCRAAKKFWDNWITTYRGI